MSDHLKSCDNWYRLQLHRITTDRLLISGRRGTGKSTGAKRVVSEDGASVLWIARTKPLAHTLPSRFVPPAVSHILPQPELMPSDPDAPLFRFGGGKVQVVPMTMITAIRDTGISVDGRQADAVILDECFPPTGAYKRDEPLLLDDLAATVGRSGSIPPVVVIGNPISNHNPYAYKWHVDVFGEGVYEYDGRSTEVQGTSGCCDCFGRQIGQDAVRRVYAQHLTSGGDVVTVNGRGLRVREVGSGWLYVGSAEPGENVLMQRDRYTPVSLSTTGTRFLLRCKTAAYADRVVYDNYDSELLFGELLRRTE